MSFAQLLQTADQRRDLQGLKSEVNSGLFTLMKAFNPKSYSFSITIYNKQIKIINFHLYTTETTCFNQY